MAPLALSQLSCWLSRPRFIPPSRFETIDHRRHSRSISTVAAVHYCDNTASLSGRLGPARTGFDRTLQFSTVAYSPRSVPRKQQDQRGRKGRKHTPRLKQFRAAISDDSAVYLLTRISKTRDTGYRSNASGQCSCDMINANTQTWLITSTFISGTI